VNESAEFFNEKNLKGPIFNNYDIGGYLIFHLFPKEKVFVDNRPEAYPSSFFEKEYISMQENEEIWHELNEKYNFNVIFFYRHDLTPWAQKFLISRIDDPQWAPIFVDQYSIIFLRNTQENKNIINRYKIPRELFWVSSNR
ncbi:MAG: hypothetical protein ACK4JE_00935, partial [Endomicrobiia bacterium]